MIGCASKDHRHLIVLSCDYGAEPSSSAALLVDRPLWPGTAWPKRLEATREYDIQAHPPKDHCLRRLVERPTPPSRSRKTRRSTCFSTTGSQCASGPGDGTITARKHPRAQLGNRHHSPETPFPASLGACPLAPHASHLTGPCLSAAYFRQAANGSHGGRSQIGAADTIVTVAGRRRSSRSPGVSRPQIPCVRVYSCVKP